MLKGIERRIKIIILTQSIYSFVTHILVQYNVLFAQALGASGTDIGLISLINALVLFLCSPLLGRMIEKYSMKKVMLLGLVCDMVAMFLFIIANEWRMLIPAFAICIMLFRQIAFADMVLITFTAPQKRATLMGFSRILWGISMILASPIAASIVTYFGGINVDGIRPLYYICLALLLATSLILYKGLDDFFISNNFEKSGGFHNLFKEYWRLIKAEFHLKYWFIVRFFRGGSLNLAMTFAPIWIVNVKGATAMMFGTLTAASTICGLLAQFPVGKLADKFGRKKTFILFNIFYCLGLITLAFAPSFEYLMLASILGIGIGGLEGGGIGGASIIPFIAMWWESVPSGSRGKLYGFEGMIMAAVRLFIPFGGILWDHGLKTLVILIPALAELLITIPLVSRIPEKRE